MNIVLLISVIIILAIIIYQDFRYRAVSWILFPVLFVFLFILSSVTNGIQSTGTTAMYNSLFFFSQLLIGFLYLYLKKSQQHFSMHRYIGMGDILFFLAISPFIQLPYYILFLLSGMAFILIIYGIIYLLYREEILKRTIPLAGIMSAYLLAIITIQLNWPNFMDWTLRSKLFVF